MIAYRLSALTSSFAGTDHESSRDQRILAYSKDKATLEEVRALMCGDDTFFGLDIKSSPYCKAAVEYYEDYKTRHLKKNTFSLTLKSGKEIEIDLVPVDNYYGSGRLNDLIIEEFEYVAPDEFI